MPPGNRIDTYNCTAEAESNLARSRSPCRGRCAARIASCAEINAELASVPRVAVTTPEMIKNTTENLGALTELGVNPRLNVPWVATNMVNSI